MGFDSRHLTKEKKALRKLAAFLIRMRLTPLLNGKGFGQLYKVRGQTRYHISPMEQRAFRRSHLQGCPQRLVEVQVQRGILVPTCPAILHDLHRVREGARKAVEETGGPVRLERDAPTRHSSRNFSLKLATTSKSLQNV